jgi:hypothetical protein
VDLHPDGFQQAARTRRQYGCLPEVAGTNPEEKADDRPPCVTNSLVDAMVATDARQCLAVVLWEKPVEREGARSDSVRLGVWREQLDSRAPQRFTISDDSHGGA